MSLPELVIGGIFVCQSGQYVIQEFIGEGSFGKVAKCLNLLNNETVAIKIHKSHLSNNDIQHEVAMLYELSNLNPDENNMVRFIDYFGCENSYCLAFEMLDKSLWDLMKARSWKPLTLNEIRPITQQMLIAFNALKGRGIMHADVKVDNIMLVNHQDQPFKVKLIDFGLALPASKAQVGMTMQAPAFRAPEVFLGLPISEAIDMWGLGCVLTFLYLGNYLFPNDPPYETMNAICQMLGQPEDHLLNAGTKTSDYFIKKVDSNNLGWRLKTKDENMCADDDNKHGCYSVAQLNSDCNLDDIVQGYPETTDAIEYADRMEFLHFLKGLLHVDGERRLTPSQALQHNFITMAHLKGHSNTSYAKNAHRLMAVCTSLNESGETADCLSKSKQDGVFAEDNWTAQEILQVYMYVYNLFMDEASAWPDLEGDSIPGVSAEENWTVPEILEDYNHLYNRCMDEVSAWTDMESDLIPGVFAEDNWAAQAGLQDDKHLSTLHHGEVSAWTGMEGDSIRGLFAEDNWAAQAGLQDDTYLSTLHHGEVSAWTGMEGDSIPGVFAEENWTVPEILEDNNHLHNRCMVEVLEILKDYNHLYNRRMDEVSAWTDMESDLIPGVFAEDNWAAQAGLQDDTHLSTLHHGEVSAWTGMEGESIPGVFAEDNWAAQAGLQDNTYLTAKLSLPELVIGGMFVCQSGQYVIQEFIGEGSFGKVAKCLNLLNNETVAIKIYKSHLSSNDIQHEVAMLYELSNLNPDENNMVRFIDYFGCENSYCLAFEMLDKSLWDLMKARSWKPLMLNEIRPITQQMLIAFNALKGLGIMHADVKMDNIMLVNHQDQPFKVKLIDFGLALPASKAQVGMTMQAPAFRAPEVFLGLPISEAIDMWGLGCVLTFLYLGSYLFPNDPPYETMNAICQMLGQPEDHLLNAGTKTSDYFIKKVDSNNLGWRLKTKDENMCADDDNKHGCYSVAQLNSDCNLDDIVQGYPETTDAIEYADRMEFLHFLKGLLHVDGERRLTPSQALQHNFITMAHLKGHSNTSYAKNAHRLMAVCTSLNESGETADCLSKSKQDGVFAEDNWTAQEILQVYMYVYNLFMDEASAWPDLEGDSIPGVSAEENWTVPEILEDYNHLYNRCMDEVSAWTDMESDLIPGVFAEDNWAAQAGLQDDTHLSTLHHGEVSAWTGMEGDSIRGLFAEDNWAAQAGLQDDTYLSTLHHGEVSAWTGMEGDSIPGVFAEENWTVPEILEDNNHLHNRCMVEVLEILKDYNHLYNRRMDEVSAWTDMESDLIPGVFAEDNWAAQAGLQDDTHLSTLHHGEVSAWTGMEGESIPGVFAEDNWAAQAGLQDNTYLTAKLYLPELVIGGMFVCQSGQYVIQEFIGEGSFGKVAKCLNLLNNETVAIKIYKSHLSSNDIQHEVAMLYELSNLNPDENNMVRFIDYFGCENSYCLAFEMLDKSLWDLMKARSWKPLMLNEIRPITQQMLIAFNALKGLGIMHADVKMDNIMLVNHQDQPFKVKLIDFGLALPASKAQVGMTMQALAFRAPEVFLGLPISEAIDMWGLGCVLTFLYLGSYLFPNDPPYETMNAICQMLGQPEDHLLNAGTKTSDYFIKKVDSNNLGWRLKTKDENMCADDDNKHGCYSVAQLNSDCNLDDIVQGYPETTDAIEYADRMEFLHFLKGLLHVDGERRLTPSQALQHNFITMAHLKGHSNTSYAKNAHKLMAVCTSLNESGETADCLSKSKQDGVFAEDNWTAQEILQVYMYVYNLFMDEASAWPDLEGDSIPGVSAEENWTVPEILEDYNHLYNRCMDEVSAWTDMESDLIPGVFAEDNWAAQAGLQDDKHLSTLHHGEVSAWTGMEGDSIRGLFAEDNWAAQAGLQDDTYLSTLHHGEVSAWTGMEGDSIPGVFAEENWTVPEILEDNNHLHNRCMVEVLEILKDYNHLYNRRMDEVSAWTDMESDLIPGVFAEDNWAAQAGLQDDTHLSTLHHGEVSAWTGMEGESIPGVFAEDNWAAQAGLQDNTYLTAKLYLPELVIGGMFVCQSGQYVIQEFIGEGSFGKVAKCLNLLNNETVAIKIYKSHLSSNDIQHEVAMLYELSNLNPDENNMVRFIDYFGCENSYCLAFEMLDKSLWDLMKARSWKPLMLNEIRPITQQMLIAFNALKGLGIMHADVKMDNIMLVNHQDQPFKVKLIDFGLALPASKAQVGMTMQAPAFRAPEVFLGLPISEAIDMWGLGCVLTFLYLGSYLFPNDPPYETMNAICQMLGQPEDHLLNAGTKTSDYFIKKVDSNNLGWRLKTKDENMCADDDNKHGCYSVAQLNSDCNLDDIVQGYPETTDAIEYADRMEFLHFLKGLLHVDGERRLTPSQALQHNFITMAHLKGHSNTSYAKNAHKLMAVCTSLNESGETADCLSKSKQDGVFTEDNWAAQAGLQDDTHLSTLHHGEVSAWTGMEGESIPGVFAEGNWAAQAGLQDDTYLTAKMSLPELVIGGMFVCQSGQYVIQEFIGEGSFGKVAKCLNLLNNETVAIKIYKSHLSSNDIQHEVAMLYELSNLNPDENNMVRFIDYFGCENSYCLAFEMLDKSLWDLMKARSWKPLMLNEIRPITQQMLIAFNALKGLGIMHADVKMDNIMLVNHQDQPFKVKLIDFGLALPASKAQVGMTMQAPAFRAPEVFLGLPISEAIDMWGLGCVLTFLYLGSYLFPNDPPYETMNAICQMLGQPEDHLLNAGTKTSDYFIKKVDSNNLGWRLKTKDENMCADDDNKHGCYSVAQLNSDCNLDDIVQGYPETTDAIEYADRMEFLHFLKGLLHVDGERRLTPSQALQHNFITMAHLKGHSNTSYAKNAHKLMAVCTSLNESGETADCLSKSKQDGVFTEDNWAAQAGLQDDTHLSTLHHGEVSAWTDMEGESIPGVFAEGNWAAQAGLQDDTYLTAKMSLPELVIGGMFVCQSGQYVIQEFIGEGSFGKVAKCLNLLNNETVAIKIYKSHLSNNDIQHEVAMLYELSNLNPDENNMVRFIDYFGCENSYCLAFEMLDKSLWDLMKARSWKPLMLNEIRPITQQMLIAFNALKGLGIMHADVKVDNIMLVNHQDQPFKVKLIDFGLALPASKAQVGMTMQAPAFRAPEVFLGLPISEAIDMWGLGCVLTFLYLGSYLFPNDPPYETMKAICQMLGQPEDHLLNAGTKTSDYFIKKVDSNNLGWRLKTKDENMCADDDNKHGCYSVAQLNSDCNLDDIVQGYPETTDAIEYADRMEFLHFLKGLLHVDGERRLTPSQALQHNFITMAHLKGHSNTSYAKNAHRLMAVCTSLNESGETADCLSKSKQDGVFAEDNWAEPSR